MKLLPRLTIALLIIAGLISTILLAQATSAQTRSETVRSRAIRMKYDTGKIDGLRIIVYLVNGKNIVAVDPSREFTKGEQIKIEFESNFDGYVYFVNVPPSGKSAVIYPDPKGGESDNLIRARQRYVLPHTGTFEFVEDEKGTEVVQVIMSREPIQVFEDSIRNSNGQLGETVSSAAAELTGETRRSGIDTESVSKVVPSGVRTRNVRLAPPRTKDEKGTVVAVPDTKLKPGEVAVFEIRLRRV
ncbi:MAG: DUF4384 domain-containing protein [Acidobacteriota bacterium]